MAVAAAVLSDVQRSVLEAVCDTYVPSVESSSGDPIEREFLARSAGDMLVAAQIEGMFAETLLRGGDRRGRRPAGRDRRRGLPRRRPRRPHGAAARPGRRRPRRQAGPHAAKGADHAAVLRRARRDHGAQRQLGGHRLSRAGLCGALGRRGAEDDRAGGAVRDLGDIDVRRGDRRLGRRRLGDRGGVRPRRQDRARARDGPVQERAGLQPARGAGLPGAVLRRRAGDLGERVAFPCWPARRWAAGR